MWLVMVSEVWIVASRASVSAMELGASPIKDASGRCLVCVCGMNRLGASVVRVSEGFSVGIMYMIYGLEFRDRLSGPAFIFDPYCKSKSPSLSEDMHDFTKWPIVPQL